MEKRWGDTTRWGTGAESSEGGLPRALSQRQASRRYIWAGRGATWWRVPSSVHRVFLAPLIIKHSIFWVKQWYSRRQSETRALSPIFICKAAICHLAICFAPDWWYLECNMFVCVSQYQSEWTSSNTASTSHLGQHRMEECTAIVLRFQVTSLRFKLHLGICSCLMFSCQPRLS